MKNKEIEFKYKAENISLKDFIAFCESKRPEKTVVASGYDHFYDHMTDENKFCRHRAGHDSNQFTFKHKTTDKNNYVRTERNINLTNDMSREDIQGLLGEFGYQYNTSIFKNCFIYNYAWYTIVYYVVYDTDMHEVGRFIELEMKETPEWPSEDKAWNELLVLEKLCRNLGATPQTRVKRSLYELCRKKTSNE